MMDLRILKILYKNIRDFKELELDFTNKELSPYHISLVQMPNGTGKTTTITLLRGLLAEREFEKGEIQSFKPTNFEAQEGVFEVDLAFSNDPFTIRLVFNYDEGTSEYYYSRPSRENGGLERGYWLPLEIRHVFNESFTQLFIFDGELSKRLLNSRETEAEKAIRSIYFLDKLQSQLGKIDDACNDIYTNLTKKTSVHTEQGLQGLITRKETANKTLKNLKSEIIKLSNEINELKAERTKKEKEKKDIIKENKNILEEYNKLDKKIDTLKKDITSETSNLLSHLRKPSFFSRRIRDNLEQLVRQMTILKLPKTTSTEFFNELANSKTCVCGREIDLEARKNILKNKDRFLSEEDISIQNAIKNYLRNLPDFTPVKSYITKINKLQIELRKNQQRRDSLQQKLDPNSKEKAEKLNEDIQKLETNIESNELILKLLTTDNPSLQKDYGLKWENNKPLCEDRMKELTLKIREATNTIKFGKKADLLKDIIKETVRRGLDSLKESIVERTNKRISKILKSDEIHISKIDQAIFIDKKESVSEGQSLLVGYAFLSTLFEQSPFKVPFVVDSPAVSIDFEVRREVAEMIPSLFDQMIVFIISSEREGFVEGLKTQRGIQYYTVRKIKDSIDPTKIKVNSDKNFFMRFQSEEGVINNGDGV